MPDKDLQKEEIIKKYNLDDAKSNWKVSPSKFTTLVSNLPTNFKLLTEFMLGKDKPININDFTKNELVSIITLAEKQEENKLNVKNRKLKGQPENVTTVSGYDLKGRTKTFPDWVENNPYFTVMANSLSSPDYQVRTSLGKYDVEETPSSLIVKDAYDMNIKQRDLPKVGDRKNLSKILDYMRVDPEMAGEFISNIIRPNPKDSRKFDLVIPKRKPDKPSPRDTAYQAPMQLEEKPKDNPRVKEKVPEGFDILKFNKGGAVMNEQMEMAFMQEGGLKDDGMDQDPVSGNEVPFGSMASEVRDDISAQLSEGEYVVPADVVRYLGVKHFEDLRDKAKQGLQTMEANGRIGGEPVPVGGPQAAPMMQPPMPQMAMGGDLSPEEMNEINSIVMAQGGMVPDNSAIFTDPYQQQQTQHAQPMAQGLNVGGPVTQSPTAPEMPQASSYSSTPSGGFSWEDSVSITEPEVPVENEDSCKAKGKVFNEITGMCEEPETPVIETPVIGSDDSDGPTTPPTGTQTEGAFGFGTFGQGVDWTDPEQAMKFIDGEYTPIDPATRKAVVGAGMIIGGPLAFLSGAATTYDALEDISSLRASVIIAKAYGNTAAEQHAQAKLEDYLAQAPGIASGAFGNWTASGHGKAGDLFKSLGVNLSGDPEEWENQQEELQKLRDDPKKNKPVTPEPTKEVIKESILPPPSTARDDSGPSAAEIAAKASQASTATPASRAKAMSAARQRGGVSASTAAKLSGSQMKAGSGVGSGAGGSNYAGPMNKGGLMLKKKKKK